VKLESINLRRSDALDERWVQQQIVDDPSILGLGDLIVKDKERIQGNAGRLDLLLQNPETLKRYEVEIQLGSTNVEDDGLQGRRRICTYICEGSG
jgi:hypothetical protein